MSEDDTFKILKYKRYHPEGYVYWVNDKEEYHREDGPALIQIDGSEIWFYNGHPHRVGTPAAIWYNGDKEWWIHGERHREDGPAIEYANGERYWYIHGSLQRNRR